VKDTVDYKSIAKRCIGFVEEAQFHLVETLAQKLAMTLLAEFDIAWIRLSLNKPGAIRGSRDVGVSIERRWADKGDDFLRNALQGHARWMRWAGLRMM
jgi:dihydroneopterin aldolase